MNTTDQWPPAAISEDLLHSQVGKNNTSLMGHIISYLSDHVVKQMHHCTITDSIIGESKGSYQKHQLFLRKRVWSFHRLLAYCRAASTET